MLVNQAALNIWRWTEARVDTAVLRLALDEVLENGERPVSAQSDAD
jgi:hypothetical protein